MRKKFLVSNSQSKEVVCADCRVESSRAESPFLVGVESIVATKKKAKEGGKAIFLCISLLPFRGESFQHHPFGQQNPIQPARAKLYGLDIYFTGCPKDSGTQSTKAAIRSTEAHQRLSTSTLLNNAVLLPFARSFSKDLPQKKPRNLQRIL